MAQSPVQRESSQRSGPARKTSRPQSQWPGPGIFVKMELGVAFTQSRIRHISVGYASKNMEERAMSQRHPDSLIPGPAHVGADSWQPEIQGEEVQQRLRRRRIRSRSALQLRTSPISPVDVTLSPQEYHADFQAFHPETAFHSEPVSHPSPVSARDHRSSQPSQSPYRPSPVSMNSYPAPRTNSYPTPQTPQASSSRIPAFAVVRQSTIDRKPLPPLPSRFRLGSDDLPWNSPTWIGSGESTYSEPSSFAPEEHQHPEPQQPPPPPPRTEDPQRGRELEQLHQAMLGIDSLDLGTQWWEQGENWDRQGELGGLPSGPRGVGWAVAVPMREEARIQEYYQPDRTRSPPPAYSQGQWGWDWVWEERYGYWVRGLRRRSSVR